MYNSIQDLEDEIRNRDGAAEYDGHDYLGLERFFANVQHMIIFDVLSNESHIGSKGNRMRLYLSEQGYNRALNASSKGHIKIISHAGVNHGKLTYDHDNQLR